MLVLVHSVLAANTTDYILDASHIHTAVGMLIEQCYWHHLWDHDGSKRSYLTGMLHFM